MGDSDGRPVRHRPKQASACLLLPVPDPMAWQVDAFAIPWDHLEVYAFPVYAFPPIAVLRLVINRVLSSNHCLLYTSPSPRDGLLSRMPSSA